MEEITIKNVAIAAVVLGSIGLLYINRKKIMNLCASPKGKKNRELKESQNGEVMAEVYKSFLMYADNFQGLYEPIYKASIGTISHERMKNVLAEWDIRMNSILHVSSSLRGWWNTIIANKDVLSSEELQMRLQKVMQMIENAGIVRDKKSEFVAEDGANLYYTCDEGIKFEIGQSLRVESPCWYLPSNPVRIIEKGYCEIL